MAAELDWLVSIVDRDRCGTAQLPPGFDHEYFAPMPDYTAEDSCRRALDTTRTVAIPLLERLDAEGIARRVDSTHRVVSERTGQLASRRQPMRNARRTAAVQRRGRTRDAPRQNMAAPLEITDRPFTPTVIMSGLRQGRSPSTARSGGNSATKLGSRQDRISTGTPRTSSRSEAMSEQPPQALS